MSAIKLILAVKRKPGLSAEEFREIYENMQTHVGLRLFGHLWTSYRRHYIEGGQTFAADESVPVAGNLATQPFAFDCISEIVYPNMEALQESARIAAIPENHRLIVEEEEALFDRPACWTLTCKVVDYDPPIDSAKMGNPHTAHLLKD